VSSIFLARQQGDFAHLREVHADGIVDALGAGIGGVRDFLHLFDFFFGGPHHRFIGLIGARCGDLLVPLRFVEELDAKLVELLHERIKPVGRDGVVRKELIELFVGEIPLGLAFGDKQREVRIGLGQGNRVDCCRGLNLGG
jgi:hypothetical protein